METSQSQIDRSASIEAACSFLFLNQGFLHATCHKPLQSAKCAEHVEKVVRLAAIVTGLGLDCCHEIIILPHSM
ncbi:MAG: hypothetical protein ABL869_12440 [Candidatus Nitrotoga sp.]